MLSYLNYILLFTMVLPIFTLPKVRQLGSSALERRHYNGEELHLRSGGGIIHINQFFVYIILNTGNGEDIKEHEALPTEQSEERTTTDKDNGKRCPQSLYYLSCEKNSYCNTVDDCYNMNNATCCATNNSEIPCCVISPSPKVAGGHREHDVEPESTESTTYIDITSTSTTTIEIQDWVDRCPFSWQTTCQSTELCFFDGHCASNETCCRPPDLMPCCVSKYESTAVDTKEKEATTTDTTTTSYYTSTTPFISSSGRPVCPVATSECRQMDCFNVGSCLGNEVCCYPGSGASFYCCPPM